MTRLVQNQQDLVKWVREQPGKMDLAVAFWGNGAVAELGLATRGKQLRVLLDLSAGATNPFEVRKLLDIVPGCVKHIPNFHAKAYLSRKEAIIGSANASANGLGSEGTAATRWHELGVHITDRETISAAHNWFESNWRNGNEITEARLKQQEFEWKQRQKGRPMTSSKKRPLLSAACADPDAFMHRGIFVVVSTEEKSRAASKQEAALEDEVGHPIYSWEGWSDIPTDAHLVSFVDEGSDGYAWDDRRVYYSPRERNDHGLLTLVQPSSVPNHSLDRIDVWARALTRAKAAIGLKKWTRDGGICIDLGEFARLYGHDKSMARNTSKAGVPGRNRPRESP